MNRRIKTTILTCLRTIAVPVMAAALFSCGDASKDFDKALAAGNLTEAAQCLREIDDRSELKSSALQLIKTYLSIDEPDKAIDVYENITSWHMSRDKMSIYNAKYENEACKLLREYLIQNGQYERAWNYYPLDYDDENYVGNARCRYVFLSDVVAAICAKGKQEDAQRFVESQLRWFVANVDSASDEYAEEEKKNFNSEAVREKLYAQIDNSY